MADNLIFPIGFDLDKAVTDTSKDWNDKYAEKLEKLIAKKPVNVKLKLDVTQLDSLDKVKQRLAQLKIEPITPQTKAAINDLAAELKTLAKALEQVQKYSAARAAADPSAVRAARINEINERSLAKAKTEAERAAAQAALAENRLAAARLKDARAAQVNEKATRSASSAYSEQGGYLLRLTQRMAAYWSIRQVGNFLTNVREVTAQFELQRVSLGAIIQDQTRANQLFSEIKNFALKSPVKIMDLTKYTKQLAAYKIETEELFETTKKLTDVSVGLGVSMDRVVLAYGQTRATGYLRASEIRQFTEMGVPIVEELAAKLSKMNGELVTAADVMDMVSKRGISFELVKDVFDDMTSAGGMFYNIQEKQGNTLFGMWAKLGDAASVMYDKIGRSETVNKGMKETIQLLTDMMRNWEDVGRNIAEVALVLGGYKIKQMAVAKATAIMTAFNKADIAVRREFAATVMMNSKVLLGFNRALLACGVSSETALTATKALSVGIATLRSVLVTTGIWAVVAALGYVADRLIFVKSNAEKAAEALNNVWSETRTQQDQSVRNFEFLADKAVKAAAGSREQKEALEELQRTYKSILPQEVLELEYLEKLKGNYGSLTQAIREYVAERQKQKGIDEIADVYGAEKRKYESQLTDFFRESGLSEQEIARFWERFYKIAGDKSMSLPDIVADALQSAGVKGFSSDMLQKALLGNQNMLSEFNKAMFNKLGISFGEVDKIDLLHDAILAENQALEQNDERAKAAVESTNAFAKAQADAAQKVKDYIPKTAKGAAVGSDTYLGEQMIKNFEIGTIIDTLKDGFKQANLTWDKEYSNFIAHIEKSPEDLSAINFDAISEALIKALDNPNLSDAQRKYLQDLLSLAQTSQQRYSELAPKNATVAQIRTKFIQIADSFELSMDKMKKYMWDGSGNVDEYLKRLKEQQEELRKRLKAEEQTLVNMGTIRKWWNKLMGNNIEDMVNQMKKEIAALDKEIEFVEGYTIPTDSGKKKGRSGAKGSDPRLGILQEMVSTLKQVNKEYDELAKKEGVTSALRDTKRIYADTFKNLQSLSTKYNFKLPKFDVPTDAASLNKYLNAIREAMKKVPKSDKAVLSLKVDMEKIEMDELQKKIDKQMQTLQDRLSRTRTAKSFFDKILDMTGDYDLALNMTMSVTGDTGEGLQQAIADNIRGMFGGIGVSIPVEVIDETNRVNYRELEKFVNELKEARVLGEEAYKRLTKAAQDGQKDTMKVYEGYLKDLEVAKTYADKRVELARDTANKIAEIQSDPNMNKQQKDRLIAGYNEREAREAAKLEYEAFKDTPLYVQMFDDLENASNSALTRMRDKLVALKDQWKNLDPKDLKEMQSRLNEIEKQIAAQNPFKALADAYKKYRELRKSGRTQKGDEAIADEAEKARQIAKQQMLADDKEYQDALRQYGAESDITKEKKKQADMSKAAYEAVEKSANEAQNNAAEWKDVSDKIRKALSNLKKYQEALNDAFGGIHDIMEAFGTSEEDMQFFDDVVGGFNKVVDAGFKAADSVANIASSNPLQMAQGVGQGISAIGGLVSGVSDLFSAGKVRRANKEIKKQAEILSQLEYSYGRLQKAMDEVFGSEYIQNYQQQQQNLQAQIAAKEKQIAAERSKGKKKDEEAIKQWEQQIKELEDELADMQNHLSKYFLGSDITAAARDFASSWLDAKKSFESTTDAMREKFKDMVQNMVIEAMAGAVMKNALQPFYDAIDKATADGELSATNIASAVQVGLKGIEDANNGMEVLWEQLKAAGLDVNQFLTDKKEGYTGIAKDVAGATSEEINAVASIGNTVMYHTSFLPLIYQQLVAQAGGGVTQPIQQAATGWTDWQQQAMNTYMAIQQNTADTVVECRRSAQACEQIAGQLSRVIRTKGSTTGVNTFLNN